MKKVYIQVCVNLQNKKKLRCFLEKFTQLTKILHDRRSRQSRQISSLFLGQTTLEIIFQSKTICHQQPFSLVSKLQIWKNPSSESVDMGQGWLHVPRQHFFDRTFPPDLLLQLICPMRSPSSAANVPSSIFTDFTNMASEVSGMVWLVTIKTMPIVDHKQHSTGAIVALTYDHEKCLGQILPS